MTAIFLRTLRGRHLVERAAEELDDAAERAQLARHGAQYRGLAGAVGADERHDLTRPHRQADVAHERPLPVPHRKPPAAPARSALGTCFFVQTLWDRFWPLPPSSSDKPVPKRLHEKTRPQ